MKPFFSVIIPVLNEEIYLPKLLACFYRQTYTAFEVIIADGGSTDDTMKHVREWKRRYTAKKLTLTVLPPKKQNVSSQRNRGARRARGAYFIFFDADVAIPRTFLKDLHAYIDRQNPDFLTTWLAPDERTFFSRILLPFMNWGTYLLKDTKKPILPGFNIVIRRDAFEDIGGFDEKVVHAEDFILGYNAREKGYRMHMIKDIVQTMSLRRYRTEGKVAVLWKYTQALVYTVIVGPIRSAIFRYPMGGSHYKNE